MTKKDLQSKGMDFFHTHTLEMQQHTLAWASKEEGRWEGLLPSADQTGLSQPAVAWHPEKTPWIISVTEQDHRNGGGPSVTAYVGIFKDHNPHFELSMETNWEPVKVG